MSLTDTEIEAIARRVAQEVLQRESQVIAARITQEVTDRNQRWREEVWDAIAQLRAVVVRLEAVTEFQEKGHKESRAAQAKTERDIMDIRVEQAKNASIWGAASGGFLAVLIEIIKRAFDQ